MSVVATADKKGVQASPHTTKDLRRPSARQWWHVRERALGFYHVICLCKYVHARNRLVESSPYLKRALSADGLSPAINHNRKQGQDARQRTTRMPTVARREALTCL